eukprot:TRINITY_DN6984_c0_g1_i3.p1 TRINITY_DN6984_c0_g1~~TRINITY_DN6984_c0_g1_i3.p1  ORF type:complete len:139 (+),score=26.44 TRINITY_DN6984_c0_g1_i3:125-541(+)
MPSFISFLMPGVHSKTSSLEPLLGDLFGCENTDQIEIYKLVRLDAGANLEEFQEVAIKLVGSSLSLKKVEGVLAENSSLKIQLEKCKESLKQLSSEMTKTIMSSNFNERDVDTSSVARYQKKIKEMEEENKKLRNIIK